MSPDIPGNVSTVYLTQGVLGASCVVLALVILKLWAARENDRTSHKADIAAKDALINELQEQRLTEALASRDVIRSIQTTLDAFLQAVRGKGMQ